MTQISFDLMEVLVEPIDSAGKDGVNDVVEEFFRRALPKDVRLRVDYAQFRPDSKFQRFRAPCWD